MSIPCRQKMFLSKSRYTDIWYRISLYYQFFRLWHQYPLSKGGIHRTAHALAECRFCTFCNKLFNILPKLVEHYLMIVDSLNRDFRVNHLYTAVFEKDKEEKRHPFIEHQVMHIAVIHCLHCINFFTGITSH